MSKKTEEQPEFERNMVLRTVRNMRNAGLCENGGEIVYASIGLCSCGKCPTPRPDYRKQG